LEVTARFSFERWLSSGNHPLRVEYYERTSGALIRVWWTKVGYPSAYPDWKAEYWSNPNLSGNPSLVRNDVTIDFNWGYGSPAAGIPVDNFSARWTRSWNFSEGVYRFHATMDDGVRVYMMDNVLVIDDWREDARREVSGAMAVQWQSRPARRVLQVSWPGSHYCVGGEDLPRST
jgi:hypothetical protein